VGIGGQAPRSSGFLGSREDSHDQVRCRIRTERSAIDKERLSGPVDDFEGLMAEGTNPRKRHLLRCLVKKVLVHDRLTVEVWYGLLNSSQVSRLQNLAPQGGLESPTLR